MYYRIKDAHPARLANLPIAYITTQSARQCALVNAGASRSLAAYITKVSPRTVWQRTASDQEPRHGRPIPDLDTKLARDTLYLLELDGVVKDYATTPYKHTL